MASGECLKAFCIKEHPGLQTASLTINGILDFKLDLGLHRICEIGLFQNRVPEGCQLYTWSW